MRAPARIVSIALVLVLLPLLGGCIAAIATGAVATGSSVHDRRGVGTVVELGGRFVRSLPANHTVPALGFHVYNDHASLVFSGDTGPNDEFWQQVNTVRNLRYVIIETAFPNRDQDLAVTSRHLYPIQLADELAKLQREAQILVTHLKPSDRQVIERELDAWAGRFAPRVLERGEILEL